MWRTFLFGKDSGNGSHCRHPCATIIPMKTNAHNNQVTGRFAPSPSGRMHLGNVFSCLVAWLGARSVGGRIVLRIEDLDPRAQHRDYAQLLMDDLLWLGLDWDEGPTYQSENGSIYDTALEMLARRGLVYPCFCTRAELHAASAPHASDGTYVYPGTCRMLREDERVARSALRNPAMRLMVPRIDDSAGHICFDDLVYGHHEEVLAEQCGDFVVRRSDGIYAYQLAVVVDDARMGVTQVVRGCDLLGSVARQCYLYRLLGYEPPSFAHVPLLVAPDGRRLSKRDRDFDLGILRKQGVAPERVIGLLAAQIGLASLGEDVTPRELAGRFSWGAIRAHRADIVVDDAFLSVLK